MFTPTLKFIVDFTPGSDNANDRTGSAPTWVNYKEQISLQCQRKETEIFKYPFPTFVFFSLFHLFPIFLIQHLFQPLIYFCWVWFFFLPKCLILFKSYFSISQTSDFILRVIYLSQKISDFFFVFNVIFLFYKVPDFLSFGRHFSFIQAPQFT